MAVKVIVGSQWGDEGKGKITDILAEHMDLVVRYQGGNNAGHTVVVGDKTFKLHLIPSGVLYKECCCVIANGVVIDPEVFFGEIETLKKQGVYVTSDQLKVSSIAHVILPFHKLLDNRQESKRHEEKIGTTGRGIGPTYTDKVARSGVRIMDLMCRERLAKKIRKHQWELLLPDHELDIEGIIDQCHELGKKLAPFVIDTSLFINQAIDQNKNIILEGAQGTMLDVDHGTYPFVTSSNPVSGGACVGAGIGPHKIDEVLGVVKAYVSRVGEGPFPTELHCETGLRLREKGCEYGTTTGRPRRCGWLDMVALRYAIRVNGMTEICLTKLDVLDGLPSIKICVGYEIEGQLITEFPLDVDDFTSAKPIYEEHPGWTEDISSLTDFDALPENAKDYVRHIELVSGVRIGMVSVGSKRDQTIHLLQAH